MARVFILEKMNESKRHISLEEARDFGELIYIFDGKSNRPSIWSEEFKAEVIGRFKKENYDPLKDYFCVAGYFVPIVITISELIVEYGEIRSLLFSASEQHYLPRRLGANYDEEIEKAGGSDCGISQGDLSRT